MRSIFLSSLTVSACLSLLTLPELSVLLLPDDSLSHLTQLDETDRCQAARTFALHAKGRLALEETRRVQRKLIQSQEQAFRWPIFVGLALAVVVSFHLFQLLLLQ